MKIQEIDLSPDEISRIRSLIYNPIRLWLTGITLSLFIGLFLSLFVTAGICRVFDIHGISAAFILIISTILLSFLVHIIFYGWPKELNKGNDLYRKDIDEHIK